MSTSLLYHGFGIRGYRYVRTEYVEGGVVFAIERKPETCRCAVCGRRTCASKGGSCGGFGLPIGSKRVALVARIPRLACHDCGRSPDGHRFRRPATHLHQVV